MADNIFLQEALTLAARGWPVFPCQSRGKKPLVTDWPHRATCDTAELEAHWLRFPTGNVAIATGARSGIFVLDVDGQEGSDSLQEWARAGKKLPDTLRVMTARGSHLYFAWPTGTGVRNSVKKLAPGLDVRGEGGYVIAPPSVHESGHIYQFFDPAIAPCTAPEWLLESIAQTQASQAVCGTLREKDHAVPDGERNATLTSFAGTMQRRGMSSDAIEAALLAENANRCSPPLPDAEVRAIARSISRYAPPPVPESDGQETGDGAPRQCSYGGGRFESGAQGVFFIGTNKDGDEQPPRWICGPLKVVAVTRDAKSNAWGRLLEWPDADGVRHQWAMPLALLQGDGVDVRSELARQGLSIAPGRHARERLASFLQVWPVEDRARCVERLGWHGTVYVTPAESIGEDSEQVVFQNAHAIEPAFSVAGAVEDWRREVAALAAGNSRLVFAISVAFAGPLVEMAGEDSGGFHLRGASSSGKTTALKIAASVWGNPSAYCRLWRTTNNGLEGLAALHNDGLLILDELAQIDPREAGEAAYLLANGRGKARAARNGTARQSASWRLLFLSAGEESLSALMARAGQRPSAGQEIRLADIESDAAAGMGAFETVHRHKTPGDLATALRDAASRYYGAAGAAWIRFLVTDRASLDSRLVDDIRHFVKEVLPDSAGGQVERVARRFGLVAVAGEIATHYGLTGWQEGEAIQSAGKCFAAWLESFGRTGNREERGLLAQVRAFFEQHGASRFENVTSAEGQRTINRAGFYRADAGDRREYLVLPEAFRREVCAGFDSKSAIRSLLARGWLVPGSDGKPTQKPRLPGIGPTRVYVVGGTLWEAGE
jgi:putative DNA primase/helicase